MSRINLNDVIMAKYLDPKADLTFKKIFGEHPDLVMSLLNALLQLENGNKITDLFWDRVRRDKDMADELREVKEQLKQKDIDTARKLRAMSVMTIEQISEITGLTAEEIETL